MAAGDTFLTEYRHTRVRALLDLVAGAELNDVDDRELRFVLPGDPTRTPRRLDELASSISPTISS